MLTVPGCLVLGRLDDPDLTEKPAVLYQEIHSMIAHSSFALVRLVVDRCIVRSPDRVWQDAARNWLIG
jgi:hypothetical protein